MTRYLADVGRAVARWLADPVSGPLGPSGFYGNDAGGLITNLEDGRVLIDDEAMTTLRSIPSDRDGHVTDEDGPQLCVGADRYPLFPEPTP